MAVLDLFKSKKTISESKPLIHTIKLKKSSPFEFWESKGRLTPPHTISSVMSKGNELVVPHPDMNWALYKDIYERVPVAKTSIDHTANFAIQSGFELEGSDTDKKKVEEWMDEINFKPWALKIMKQMLIFGNSYYEFDGSKILPPEQMFVVVNKEDDGQLLGYKQLVLGQIEPIGFSIDEIIHFPWNNIISPYYGTSDFKAATSTIKRLIQFQDDIGEIIHRYGNPILHHRIGTDESPATQSQITDYIDMLAQRDVGEDLVTSSAAEINPVVANLKMIQPDGLINQLEHQLIAGLQIPGLFVKGGENTNKATADVELQAFDRKVKALRSVFSVILEDHIFKTKLNADVTISWHELSVESEVSKSEMFMNLVNGGVPVKTALAMTGWKSWQDDVDKEKKEEEKNKPPMPQFPQQFPPKPQGKPPKEDDFETQAEWFKAYEKWRFGG